MSNALAAMPVYAISLGSKVKKADTNVAEATNN